MATYLSGVTDYIPQIQPFAPDINLYANVLQTKQSKYDANWQSLNNVYSQYFYADLSREDNQERRDELMKAIDGNLKKVSGLDLSLEQNVRQAKQLFTPFYEDKYLMRDMVYTKSYTQEMNRALSAKNCVGKDCEGTYWDGGVELLNYQLDKFKKAGLEESLNVATPSYVPYFDIMKEANELVKKYNYEIVMDSSQGGYMVREKNGPNAIGSLNDFILQNFMNNPKAADFYRAQAQLGYYKDPDKTYEKYQAVNKLSSSSKADTDVKNQIQDKQNENKLNDTKVLFNAVANKTDDEIKELEYQKLLLEKSKETFGDGWEQSDGAKDLNAINIDLENKKSLQSQIDPLNTQIQSVQYKDKDGKSLSEEQLVNTVALGLLMGDALNTAQSIAMNKYSRTVTGVDPYAMARYKAQVKAMYGTSSRRSGGSGGGSGSPKPTASEKIINETVKAADTYVKSDEGKNKIAELKKDGNSDSVAKQKVKLKEIKEKTKQLEKESNVLGVKEILEGLKEEETKLNTRIEQEESRNLTPSNKANVTLNFASLISGIRNFEYVGKDGKQRSQKIGYQDTKNIYQNQHEFITSIPKTAIKGAEETYQNKLNAKFIPLFQNNNNNIHLEKALNNYVKNKKLQKTDDENDAQFATRVYELPEFQRSLVEPLFKIKNELTINLKKKNVFDMFQRPHLVIKDVIEQFKNDEPNVQKRTAHLESLKQMGLTEKDITELSIAYTTLDAQKERFFKFNESNKNAFILNGQRFLNINNLSKNELPKTFDKNRVMGKNPFYTMFPTRVGERVATLNEKELQQYVLYRSPYIQSAREESKGEIKITDKFNAVRNFMSTFIKDGKVDPELEKLIQISTPKNLSDPKKFNDNQWVTPFMELSAKSMESLRNAGYLKGRGNDIKILKFFNTLVASDEVMQEFIIDNMKALNSYGSKGNIFMPNQNSSDWAVSATTLTSDYEKVSEVSYRSKITDVLKWASEYVKNNDEALSSDFKRPGVVGSFTFVPLYIDGKPVGFDKSEEDLANLRELLNNKDKNEFFSITTEFNTYSQYANDYSQVNYRIKLTDLTSKKGKELKKEYNKYIDEDITLHFPTNINESLMNAKSKDFLSHMMPGTYYTTPDGLTTITVKNIEDGKLLLNISDIYFENGTKKILNAEEPLEMNYIKDWNETIFNILLGHSTNRNYQNI